MIRQAQVRWKTMKEHSGWYSLLSWPWTPVFGRLTPWIFTKPCSTTLLLSASFAIRKYPPGEIASNASFISLDTPLYPGLGHVGFLMPQFSSVTQSCPTLCDPMNRSMPGLHVHHQFREFTQTCFHRVGDAIQPSHSLSPPSLPVRWHHPYGRKWRRTKEPLDLFLGIKFSKQLSFYIATPGIHGT